MINRRGIYSGIRVEYSVAELEKALHHFKAEVNQIVNKIIQSKLKIIKEIENSPLGDSEKNYLMKWFRKTLNIFSTHLMYYTEK